MISAKDYFKFPKKPYSKLAFWTMVVAIVFAPILGHYHLILRGKTTMGKQRMILSKNTKQIVGKAIFYEVNGVIYSIDIPLDEQLSMQTVTVLYDSKEPENAILYTAAGLFMNYRSVFAIIMLVYWIALQVSLLEANKRPKGKRKTPFPKIKWKI